MALKPENPVVGGTVLRRAAVQSPNYVPGTSGWTINQDGSAEFNNLTIRGTFLGADFIISSSGAFFYSGTPALGNLIFSIAPSTTTADSFLNPVHGGGAASYLSGTVYTLLGAAALQLFTTGSFSAAFIQAGPAGTVTAESGSTAAGDSPAFIELLSANANDGIHRLIELAADQVQLPAEVLATASGTITFDDNVVITGNLTVDGTFPSAAGASPAGPAVTSLGLGLLTAHPFQCTSNENLADGQLVFCLATAQKSQAITKLGIAMFRAGVTPGAGVNQLALYSEAGVLLTNTGDMTSAFETGPPSWAEGSCTSHSIVQGTDYYMAVLTSFTGTAPGFIASDASANVAALNGHFLGQVFTGQSTLPGSVTPAIAHSHVFSYAMYAR